MVGNAISLGIAKHDVSCNAECERTRRIQFADRRRAITEGSHCSPFHSQTVIMAPLLFHSRCLRPSQTVGSLRYHVSRQSDQSDAWQDALGCV